MRAALLFVAFFGSCVTANAQSPETMKNRTYTATWTESREQSMGGGFKQVSVPMQMKIYVSSVGRPFARLTARDMSQDTVGGSGASLGNGVRAVNISGSSIRVQSNFGSAGRQIIIDSSGAGCSAQVSLGKTGAGTAKFTRKDGQVFEIRSMSASGASCAVSDGNSFSQ